MSVLTLKDVSYTYDKRKRSEQTGPVGRRISECRSRGLPVNTWCRENGVNEQPLECHAQ